MSCNLVTVLRQFTLTATFVFTVIPCQVLAQSADAVEEANAQMSHEPDVAETTRQALAYFRVDPDNFDGLRSASKSRAWLPLVAGGYRFTGNNFNRDQERELTTPFILDENSADTRHEFSIGAVWDFREVVFNASEVQVYGLIGVQRDIMLESTRTYYLRRQLALRLLLRPPEDPLAYAALQMRVDEFTAIIDVLTGGWFTEESNQRLKAKQRRRRSADADRSRRQRRTQPRPPQPAPQPTRRVAPPAPPKVSHIRKPMVPNRRVAESRTRATQ